MAGDAAKEGILYRGGVRRWRIYTNFGTNRMLGCLRVESRRVSQGTLAFRVILTRYPSVTVVLALVSEAS